MAKADTGASTPDRARRRVAGTFTAPAQTSGWVHLRGRFLLMATGGTGGQVVLECSADGGTTAVAISNADGAANAWNAPVCFLTYEAPDEDDLLFRLRCAALSGGNLAYRLSQ